MLQMLWEKVWKFVTKLTTLLPYEEAVPPVGPYLKEMNTHVLQKDLKKNLHNSFVHNRQELSKAQLPFIKR